MALLSSNILSTISSGSIFSELPRIVRCSLRTDDSIPRDSDLFSKMIAQDGNSVAIPKQLKATFHRYPNVFQKSSITDEKINISIMKNIYWWKYLKQYSQN